MSRCSKRLGSTPPGSFCVEPLTAPPNALAEVSRSRSGLTILVAGESEAARAAEILETQGYGVVVAPVLDEP